MWFYNKLFNLGVSMLLNINGSSCSQILNLSIKDVFICLISKHKSTITKSNMTWYFSYPNMSIIKDTQYLTLLKW